MARTGVALVTTALFLGCSASADNIALLDGIYDDDVAAVREALAAGADPSAEIEEEYPLLTAIDQGAGDIVRVLLDAGAELPPPERPAFLFEAARNDLPEFVTLALSWGLDVDIETEYDGPALWQAVQESAEAACLTLLDAGASPNQPWYVVTAMDVGTDRVFDEMLTRADYDELYEGWMSELTWRETAGERRAQLERVKRLVERFGNPAVDELNRGLVAGAGCVHPELVRYLIELGADGSTPGPLAMLASPIIPYMPDEDGDVVARRDELIDFFLSVGADIDGLGPDGRNALHLSADALDVDMMRRWIDVGADPSVPDDDSETALSIALGVTLSDIDTRDLDLAAGIKHLNRLRADAVDLLLGAGAEVNEKDRAGRTPLHRAARSGNVALTKQLLAAGADVTAIDADGLTPIEVARARRPRKPGNDDPAAKLFVEATGMGGILDAMRENVDAVIAELENAPATR